jgi:hypothetical protein
MAYTILNTDGSVLVQLADGKIDQTTTSLSLIGKNSNSFGQYLNENFVQLLANNASTSGNPPRNPLKGQLWYDTTIRKMKVYDNGFKTVGGVTVSTARPIELATGDLWFDSINMQLKILNGTSVYTVGPLYPKSVGDNGLMVPTVSIKDIDGAPQQVTVLKNYGHNIGLVSHVGFKPSVSDNTSYFNTTTQQQVVSGVTVNGDVNYTGKMVHKQLSLSIDIDTLSNTIANIGSDIGIWENVGAQNNAIRQILRQMFPTNPSYDASSFVSYTAIRADVSHYPPTQPSDYETFYETGIPSGTLPAGNYPYGTECKVLVRYSQGGTNALSGGKDGNYGQGYQIRRFMVNASGDWQYTNIEEINL